MKDLSDVGAPVCRAVACPVAAAGAGVGLEEEENTRLLMALAEL